MYRNANSIDQREQRSRFTRDLHLLVIAGGLQFAISRQDGLVQLSGTARCIHKQRRSDPVQLSIGGRKKDQPMFAEQARIELRVRVRKTRSFRIAFAEIIGRQRIAQQLGSTRDQIVCTFGKADRRHRSACDTRGVGGEGRQLQIRREQQCLVHLGQIVIFAGQPEHRYALHAQLFHLLGQGKR